MSRDYNLNRIPQGGWEDDSRGRGSKTRKGRVKQSAQGVKDPARGPGQESEPATKPSASETAQKC